MIKEEQKVEIKGLTDKEVEERKLKNQVNYDTSNTTKSIKQIIKDNFITLFNILNLVLAILVFLVASYKNMLFLLIIIINTAISTIQEINSKRMVDKLSILAISKAKVIRNSKKQEILIDEIVLDDILELESGMQVLADCIIENGIVEVNESFITGESDTVFKKKGDELLSGSIIVSGVCFAKVIHIGKDNFAYKISNGSRYVKKVKSEMMKSLAKIIRILTYAIIPIGIILFSNQYFNLHSNIQEAVVKTVAAMIGMIPEGLVLLTSTVLVVSVIRLSKRKVLVQELYCIETLARVDILCLDKTGTLTEGKMEVKEFTCDDRNIDFKNILANIAYASIDNNCTMLAIKEKFTDIKEKLNVIKYISFSSEKKYSALVYDKGSYIIGAPEIILRDEVNKYEEQVKNKVEEYRVLVVVKSNILIDVESKELPDDINVIGFIYLKDKIRKEAKNTLKYFKDQGVDIKILSGDNPITVSKIAKEVGLENFDNYIDMSQIKTEKEVKEIALKYTIFGRVSPIQKKQIINVLKEKGKTVAMTGDGVNDVLALKEADCSIAMANGSDASKNVSQLILLDSNFASMPQVVLEGRRSINNLERSASLFLVKTIYSAVLAILFIIIGEEYPFMPIQLSLISMFTIGIPSFLLALEPNKERIKGNFLKNVIKKALPTAITIILSIITITIVHNIGKMDDDIYSSLCVIATGFSANLLLFTLAKSRKDENIRYPVSIFRLILAIAMLILFIIGLNVFDWWFSIVSFNILAIMSIIICITCIIYYIIFNYLIKI